MTEAPPVAPPPRTLNLIVGLIRSYMGLTANQVVIANQSWKIPADKRLYISVGFLAIKPFAPMLRYEPTPEGLAEIQTINSQETLSINVMSFSQEAVDRKDEVILAFGSTAGQKLCEANSMKLGRLPVGFVPISQLEGTAIPNRFNVTINVLVAREQSRLVEFYNQFPEPALVIEP